ncbi:hypothetical protein EVAR_63188_1 [Eumeta japonica]|uniref:Uncharacterized protein n=1 Tax=Eumeta variegata TaxID=151549 RepID=A0A4C1ZXI9_EUMVA|nr:hypothetical protein EVAR_63188_1 [Eumeta japonica]
MECGAGAGGGRRAAGGRLINIARTFRKFLPQLPESSSVGKYIDLYDPRENASAPTIFIFPIEGRASRPFYVLSPPRWSRVNSKNAKDLQAMRRQSSTLIEDLDLHQKSNLILTPPLVVLY